MRKARAEGGERLCGNRARQETVEWIYTPEYKADDQEKSVGSSGEQGQDEAESLGGAVKEQGKSCDKRKELGC